MKISKQELKDIIMKEMKTSIEEEALIDPHIVNKLGTGTVAISLPHSVSSKKDHHKHDSYMAKPQLMKIAEYAAKLHDMICEGEQLDDWIESHIAQMADDIGDVYHALTYKKRKRSNK